MIGGKLLIKTRKQVEGTYHQHAWNDTWQESIDIDYAGELTPEVCEAIKQAFYASKYCGKAQSLYGRLRASNGDRVNHVDAEKRQLIIDCSESLCD